MSTLYEDYRPHTFDDILGQSAAIARIRTIQRRGLGGHAIWLSGKSGIGKTTLARIVASQIADSNYITELDAINLTPQRLDEIEEDLVYRALDELRGKAVIINEAHGLRIPAIRKLLVFLERLPNHAIVVFTSTTEGQMALFEDTEDAAPLMSRCIQIKLTDQGLNKLFAQRAFDIAEREGLGGKPLESYIHFLGRNKNNMRTLLSAVEAGEFMYEEERLNVQN